MIGWVAVTGICLLGPWPTLPAASAHLSGTPSQLPRAGAADTPTRVVLDWGGVSGPPEMAVKGKVAAAGIGADGLRGTRGRRAQGPTALEPESRGGR
jgi:hypothetical protein